MSVTLSILIVDEAQERREDLQQRLAMVPGWHLRTDNARGGQEAMERLRDGSYDLVFLDQRDLPVLDLIRQHHAKAAVVLTADKGSEQTAISAMKLGAVDYITRERLHRTDFNALFHRVAETRNLIHQNMELRQVNQMKNEFIANVSHELRTPLTVIIGYAHAMLDGSLGALSEPQKKALEAMTTRSESLLGTLNNILRFRESYEGHQQLLLRPLDLGELVKARCSDVKGMTVRLTLPKTTAWVSADKEKLADVIDNLLSNARKFGPAGGAARVRVEIVRGEAVVTVEDDGPGVPPEMLPHLFAPFGASTQQGPARQHPGLGIGLPLAKQVMEAHNGRVWIESQVGHGCAAKIALPLAARDSIDVIVERPQGLDKKRILIVEDNPDLVDVLMLFLYSVSSNLELATARTGIEALDSVKERVPDMLILDVMMPGMDGFEVLDRLGRTKETAAIPVLVLTGYTEAAERARGLGASAVLLKPFEKRRFIELVMQLLGVKEKKSGS
jgi:signal transduction histidine kinase